MLLEIARDNIVGDIAGGGSELVLGPEALAPITFANMFELLLDSAGGSPFGLLHKGTDRDTGRDLDEHMDMITR